jgi:iron-sulfur cluster assembly protein
LDEGPNERSRTASFGAALDEAPALPHVLAKFMSSQEAKVTAVSQEPPRVRLTAAAISWFKQRRQRLGIPNAALRLGVKGGGCAGYSYVTDLTEGEPMPRDLIYEFDGLRVYVDERSMKFIDGSTIDAKKSLLHQGLSFHNPNVEKSCGCGETFSVKLESKPG